jgi:hypothetical protein
MYVLITGYISVLKIVKKMATLAYRVYAWPPEDFKPEPNVSVAPCLQPRNYWAQRIHQADMVLPGNTKNL